MKRNSSSNWLHNATAFPGSVQRGYASPASSSNTGSPHTRCRMNGNVTLPRPQTNQLPQIFPPRAPLSRIESGSSATLFFRSPTPPAQTLAPTTHSCTNTNLSATKNRHSYASPNSSANTLHAWNTFQTRNVSPSPRSSPCGVGDGSHHRDTDMETDKDMFFWTRLIFHPERHKWYSFSADMMQFCLGMDMAIFHLLFQHK